MIWDALRGPLVTRALGVAADLGVARALAGSPRRSDEQAFGDRCGFVEGSFFESVPHGDAHLLSTILHDWDDHSARRILETVRAAVGERLVVLGSTC